MWSAFLDPIFDRRVMRVAGAGRCWGFPGLQSQHRGSHQLRSDYRDAGSFTGLGQDRQRDRDTMLVTLATYRE